MDSSGIFVGAAMAKLEHVADVVSAEAAVLMEGRLKLASTIGANSILVQMDNLVTVEAIQQNTGHSTIQIGRAHV